METVVLSFRLRYILFGSCHVLLQNVKTADHELANLFLFFLKSKEGQRISGYIDSVYFCFFFTFFQLNASSFQPYFYSLGGKGVGAG